MEVITIESDAYSLIMEKLDRIAGYMEETRQREGKWESCEKGVRADGRKRDAMWMTNDEVREALEISPRTLQRYRTKGIIPYSMIERQIRYPREEIEHLRERCMVETPAARIDRMIAEHPLRNSQFRSHVKKGRNTGKNQ